MKQKHAAFAPPFVLGTLLIAGNASCQVTVAGSCRDTNGQPVAGAQVTVNPRSQGQHHLQRTEKDGSFKIEVNTKGPYDLTVSRSGYVLVTQHSLSQDKAQSLHITLYPAKENHNALTISTELDTAFFLAMVVQERDGGLDVETRSAIIATLREWQTERLKTVGSEIDVFRATDKQLGD